MPVTMKRRKAAHPESAVQRAFVDACRHYPPARAVYAIPNGGKRGKIEAAIMKGEGVRAGMPDTHLPVAAGACIGFWVEFKAGKNGTDDEQDKRIAELVALGHHVAVVWDDWTLAWEHLHRYLRGSLGPGRVDIKPTGTGGGRCACFPGMCRGGEVINGKTATGHVCKASRASAE